MKANVLWAAVLAACTPGGIGDPCTPESEYDPTFGGFDVREVYVESKSFQCESRVCLINHFQGRESCPWGQTEADLSQPAGAPARCRLPASQDPVTVPVRAWNVERPAHETVYCSCRCAGPDPGARYCSCPDGYECRELVPEIGASSQQLAGSYCIKRGTAAAASDEAAPSCAEAPENASCPAEPFENP